MEDAEQDYSSALKGTIEALESRDDIHALDRIYNTVEKIKRHRDGYLEQQSKEIANMTRSLQVLQATVEEQERRMTGFDSDTTNGTDEEGAATGTRKKKKSKSKKRSILADDNFGSEPEGGLSLERLYEEFKHARSVLQDLTNEAEELAKEINEAEAANDANETTMQQLMEELEQLSAKDVLETSLGKEVKDSTVLKLNLYKSLGIAFDGDSPETHKRVMVHSEESNQIHTLDLENYSSFFVSNYIWDKL